jgi:hypothetical protein
MIDAMAQAARDGKEVEKVLLTKESIESFMSDPNISEETDKKRYALGEFSIRIEEGDTNTIITEDGERYGL